MWAFMPASANCNGAMPLRERASNNGAQAAGTLPASRWLDSSAAKKRFAKSTSSLDRKGGSANVTLASRSCIPLVTAR